MDYINWANEPDLDRLRALLDLLREKPAEAIPGLEGLAAQGSAASGIYLGNYFADSRSAHFDLVKARQWYSVAHELGNPPASYMLGKLHELSREYDLAFSAFSKAAEQGYPPAMYRLANMHRRGAGTARNIPECKRLLELAYSRGHVFAKGLRRNNRIGDWHGEMQRHILACGDLAGSGRVGDDLIR